MTRITGTDLEKGAFNSLRTALLALLLTLSASQSDAQVFEFTEEEDAVAIEVPADEDVEEEAPADWFNVEKEYRSGAVAGEEAEIRAEVELAGQQFKAREWGAGQALIDGVLSRVTSVGYRKRRLLDAARKLRERENLLGKTEDDADEPAVPGKLPANAQQVTEDLRIPTTEVYSSDHIRYLPLADAMRELLLSLPQEARAAYRSTYDAPAQKALDSASELPFGDSHYALRSVAERYPLTRAGREAWERLAARLADEGRLQEAAAAVAIRLSLPFDEGGTPSLPETLAQAAVLNLMAGNVKSGQRCLDEILASHPDRLVRLRGEALLGASLAQSPLLKSLLEYARTSAATASQWPAPLGGYAHAGAEGNPHKSPLLGTEARWIHHFRNPSSTMNSSSSALGIRRLGLVAVNPARAGASLYRGPHPALQIVSNGPSIFFRQGTSLVSLDTRTGKRKWTHLLDQPDNESSSQARFTNKRSSPGQEDYTDLGTRSLCVYKPGGEGPRIVMLDHSTRIGFKRSGQAVYRRNRLLCFDAGNGKLVWRVGKTENPRNPAYGLAFTAPPTPAGGLLVAPAVRESGFYMVGITLDGSIKWLTRLYSFNSSYYQRYGRHFLMGSSVAASDGVVYSAPGTGMICAVNASDGRLVWMTRYRSENRERQSNTWVHSQPIIVSAAKRPVLLAAPADSNYLSAFDAGTGRLVWERSFTSSSNQLLGADEEKIYISGSSAMALSLAKGEEAWKIKPTGSAAGMGCLVGGHIYLPRSYRTIVRIDCETGKITRKLRFRDERIPGNFTNSLFAIDDQLLSIGGWGIAAILPQQDSWKRLAGKPGAKRFEQARLLESEGRYTESLEIYYELLGTVKSKSFRSLLGTEIIAAVTRITSDNGDPDHIDRMLTYGRTGRNTPLIRKRTDYLQWRLKEAALLLKKSPARAASAYVALLSEDGKFTTSAEGNLVDARLYAIDVLGRLRYGKKAAPDDEDPAAVEDLKNLLDRLLAAEDKRFEELLSGDPTTETLRKIALFGAHTPSAAQADARLAVIELAAGRPQNARSHLRMLCEDYPVLAGLPEITRLLKQTRAEPLRGRHLRGIRQPEEGTPWQQAYWLGEDHGILVAAAAGTEPFPATFSLRGNKLVATDGSGNTVMERPLVGFPEIDNIKTRLKSNVEEPAVAHVNGNRMVLFTAAGCYAFELTARSSPAGDEEEKPGGPEQQFNATGFKLAWVQNYPHALEKYRKRRATFGSIRTSNTRNLFPKVHFSPEGDVAVLLPTGKLLCMDRHSGKYLWRAGPDNVSVNGELTLEGRNFLSQSTSPPAMLRFTLGSEGIRKLEDWDMVAGPKGMSGSHSIPGIADVMSGESIEVRSPTSGRILWNKRSSPKLLHATAESIWLGTKGFVSIVSIRSGQSIQKIPLPEDLQAAYRFEDAAAGTLTLACTSTLSNSYYCSNCGRMHTRSNSGPKELSAGGMTLVHVGRDYETLWQTRISAGSTVYDGNRHLLEDGRWLFVFNEQDTSSEKWYTRVSVIDPASGKSELWLQVEITGKGTGLLPRISPVAGGLAVGNSEGYGWFTAAELEFPERDE